MPGENGTSSEGKGLNFDSSLTDSAEPVTIAVAASLLTTADRHLGGAHGSRLRGSVSLLKGFLDSLARLK